jgi:hypothetical protein
MQPEKRTASSAPTCIANGCVTLWRVSHDRKPSAPISIHIHTERRYMPEKQRMNVSRYAVSGTIHRSGTTATFWQSSLVTARSRPVPVSESSSHIAQSPACTGASSCASSAAATAGAGRRHTCRAAHVHTTVKNTKPPDQNQAWPRIDNSRSIDVG